MNAIRIITRAVLHTGLIILIHLSFVYFLGIRFEGWDEDTLWSIVKVFIIPVVLLLINQIIFFRVGLSKYKLIWYLTTLLPNLLLMLVFRLTVAPPSEDDFILLRDYETLLMLLLPSTSTLIQLLLIYIWKVERRNDLDRC